MSRIPVPLSIVDTLAVSPPLLEAVQESFGAATDLFRLAGESPATPDGLLNLRKALEQGDLDPSTQKRIALAVRNYRENRRGHGACIDFTLNVVRQDGAQIECSRDADLSDEKARVAVALALRIVQKQGRLDEWDLAKAKRAGYTSVELLEIVGHVAFDALQDFINETFDTRTVPPVLEGARAA